MQCVHFLTFCFSQSFSSGYQKKLHDANLGTRESGNHRLVRFVWFGLVSFVYFCLFWMREGRIRQSNEESFVMHHTEKALVRL